MHALGRGKWHRPLSRRRGGAAAGALPGRCVFNVVGCHGRGSLLHLHPRNGGSICRCLRRWRRRVPEPDVADVRALRACVRACGSVVVRVPAEPPPPPSHLVGNQSLLLRCQLEDHHPSAASLLRVYVVRIAIVLGVGTYYY